MGQAEIDGNNQLLLVRADFFFYGNMADSNISKAVAADVSACWNAPNAMILINNLWYAVRFLISGNYAPLLTETDVFQNDDPKNNYFRIEAFSRGNISFVDGINSNTGYFKLDNLVNESTTAAHEFGHTIGLDHPPLLDIRGYGTPGIMYPRGTIVDPQFQYDPAAKPLQPGGTMNPVTRKVSLRDIEDLHLHTLDFNNEGFAILGDFSSVWHDAHQP